MCVIKCILKCVMGIVNTLLLIMGIVLAVIGALLLWGFQYFMKQIYDLETYITAFLTKIGIDKSATNGVLNLVSTNATVIGAIGFGVGIVLIALAIIGMITMACCSVRNLLIVVIILLILITLGLIVLVAYYGSDYQTKVILPLENLLLTSVVQKYVSLNSTEPESILANIIQVTANCCGVFNSSDYDKADKFNRNTTNSTGSYIQLQFPRSCCEYKQDFTITDANLKKCIDHGISINANIGCWSKVKPSLIKYLQYAFTSMGITIGVLLATIIITGILIKCADTIDT